MCISVQTYHLHYIIWIVQRKGNTAADSQPSSLDLFVCIYFDGIRMDKLHAFAFDTQWHDTGPKKERSGRKVLEGTFRLFVYEANLIRLHITRRHYSRQIQIRPHFVPVYAISETECCFVMFEPKFTVRYVLPNMKAHDIPRILAANTNTDLNNDPAIAQRPISPRNRFVESFQKHSGKLPSKKIN